MRHFLAAADMGFHGVLDPQNGGHHTFVVYASGWIHMPAGEYCSNHMATRGRGATAALEGRPHIPLGSRPALVCDVLLRPS